MWRENGKLSQYVYDRDDSRDRDIDYQIGGDDVLIEPGTWHSVTHRIVVNTPGVADGTIQAWFDGELALDVSDVRFRDVATDTNGRSTEIDAMFFSTFFGGSDSSWAPTKDETVYFDEFQLTLGGAAVPGTDQSGIAVVRGSRIAPPPVS